MQTSERARELTYSAIRKLVPYANEAKKKGKKIIHLNIGVPDTQTPQEFFKAVEEVDLDRLVYAPSPGLEGLRKAISNFHAKNGIHFTPEEIVVTSGASEGLFFALYLVADYGESVLTTDPYYSNYNSYFHQAGVKLRTFETKIEDGFALPDYKVMEAAVGEDTKAILLCNPGNPTGAVYSKEDLEKVAKLAVEKDIYIIADEIYSDFIYDGEFISISTLPGIEDRLIVLDSISKRYSACGARIGALMSKNKDIMEEAVKLCTARLAAPTLEQYGAIALYEMEGDYLERVNQEYKERRDYLYQLLKEIPGVESYKSQGAFYTMVSLPVKDAEAFSKWLLTDFEDQGESLMLAPAPGFYMNTERGRTQVRIAFAVDKEEIKRGMELLEKALEVYPD